MSHFDERMTARLYRITCPSPLELGEYHLNMSSPSQKLVIAAHLKICPHCSRELAQLESFLAEAEPSMESSLLQQARVIVARLLNPGPSESPVPALIALRGEAKGPITLQADGVLIVLEAQSAKDGKTALNGQIAADQPEKWNGAKAELRRAGKISSSAVIDELGAFRCEGVTAGRQELRITASDEALIIVAEFELSI